MAPGYGRKGGGGRAFGAPAKHKETMHEKVAKHRRPRGARAEDGFLPDPDPVPPETSAPSPAHVSDKVVGNLFLFSAIERATIQVVIGLYDKKLKAAVRNARECQMSEVELATLRSRCALVTDELNKAAIEDEVELRHPLRVTLGAGCSLHMRWLKKEMERMSDRMIDKGDLEDAAEITQRIAHKIGEQLVLFIEPEEDD